MSLMSLLLLLLLLLLLFLLEAHHHIYLCEQCAWRQHTWQGKHWQRLQYAFQQQRHRLHQQLQHRQGQTPWCKCSQSLAAAELLWFGLAL